MKIVLLSTSDRSGGASIAALRLHKGLRVLCQDSWMLVKEKNGRDPYVKQTNWFARKMSTQEETFRLIEQQVFARNRTAVSNTMFSLPYPGYDLSKTHLVRKADVINLHWVARYQSVESAAALLDIGKPVVWTLHDQNPFSGGCHYSAGCLGYCFDCWDCPQLSDNAMQLPAKILEAKKKYWLRNLTIVTPSRWLAECARQSSLFGKFRVEVIPNSLETDIFVPRDKASAKKALGLEKKQILLLFSSYSDKEKRKGFAEFTQALRHCFKDHRFRELATNETVKILNLGPCQGEFAVEGLSVIDLGVVSSSKKLAVAYAAADIFVMPSLEENLANVILESLACATPVVSFAVGGTPDVIQNGETGFMAPAYDCVKLADLILELIFNPNLRERLGRNGRQLVEKRFKLHNQAAKYLELFRDLLKKKEAHFCAPLTDDSKPTDIAAEPGHLAGNHYLSSIYHSTVKIQQNRFISNMRAARYLLKTTGFLHAVKALVRKIPDLLK